MNLSDFNLKPSGDDYHDGFIDLPWFNRTKEVRVYFERDNNGEPSSAQLQAFKEFLDNKEDIFGKLQNELVAYYAKVRKEAQEYYDAEYFSKTYPPISDPEVLSKRLNIKTVLINYYDEDCYSYIGLVIDCDWDIEMGVGVKLVGNQIRKIGVQDIVIL